MSQRVLAGVCGLVVLVPAATGGMDAQFRSGTGVVRLPVIVATKDGGVVRGLTRESFAVFENGRRQEVEFFAEGSPEALPLRLGLLLDTSGSMELDLAEASTAVIRFIDACEAATDVTFVDFDTTVQLGRFSPPSYPMLFARIRSREAGRYTALYDAIAVYLQSSAGRRGQRVLVLYTDGGDTASSLSFSRLQRMLRASDVLLYAVGYLEHQAGATRAQQQLRIMQLARETGGDAFFPGTAVALDATYDRILTEIESRYTLGYVPSPSPGPGFHKVEVRLSEPDDHPGVRIRTRPGYQIQESGSER